MVPGPPCPCRHASPAPRLPGCCPCPRVCFQVLLLGVCLSCAQSCVLSILEQSCSPGVPGPGTVRVLQPCSWTRPPAVHPLTWSQEHTCFGHMDQHPDRAGALGPWPVLRCESCLQPARPGRPCAAWHLQAPRGEPLPVGGVSSPLAGASCGQILEPSSPLPAVVAAAVIKASSRLFLVGCSVLKTSLLP